MKHLLLVAAGLVLCSCNRKETVVHHIDPIYEVISKNEVSSMVVKHRGTGKIYTLILIEGQ